MVLASGQVVIASKRRNPGEVSCACLRGRVSLARPFQARHSVVFWMPRAELFKAALCGLGCLGIITGVVLQCGPATALSMRTSCTTLDDVLARGWSIASSAEYVKLEWVPYAGESFAVVACPPKNAQVAGATTPVLR
jgi:FAD/FMN-containing dehydrogenase